MILNLTYCPVVKKVGPEIILNCSRILWFESKNVSNDDDAVEKDKRFHCEDILEQDVNETNTLGKRAKDVKPKCQNLDSIKVG